jgi:hypothetical protein
VFLVHDFLYIVAVQPTNNNFIIILCCDFFRFSYTLCQYSSFHFDSGKHFIAVGMMAIASGDTANHGTSFDSKKLLLKTSVTKLYDWKAVNTASLFLVRVLLNQKHSMKNHHCHCHPWHKKHLLTDHHCQ